MFIEAATEADPETKETGMINYSLMVKKFGDQDDNAWFASQEGQGGRENRS